MMSDAFSRISIILGDITKVNVDAVVNAAQNSLLGGFGVDGAIHAAAGEDLLKECVPLKWCDTGDAKITKGYKLPAKHVIHTVGPFVGRDNPDEVDALLASAYRRSLEVLVENNLHTIAFPSISTGYFMFPIDKAVPIVFRTVLEFLHHHTEVFVIFVMWTDEDFNLYNNYFSVVRLKK